MGPEAVFHPAIVMAGGVSLVVKVYFCPLTEFSVILVSVLLERVGAAGVVCAAFSMVRFLLPVSASRFSAAAPPKSARMVFTPNTNPLFHSLPERVISNVAVAVSPLVMTVVSPSLCSGAILSM